MDLTSAIGIFVQIVLQNIPHYMTKATTYEILDQEYDPKLTIISSEILAAFNEAPSIEPNINLLISSEKTNKPDVRGDINISTGKLPKDKSALLIIVPNVHHKIDLLESIFDTLKEEGFIITVISNNDNILFENLGFNVCFSRIITDSEKIVLLSRKVGPILIKQTIQVKSTTYAWVSEIQNTLSDLEPENDEKLVIFSEKEPTSGILGFYNCLRTEQKGINVRCFYIMDDNAPTFSLDNPFYKSQVDRNLGCNIYKDGKWGAYWYLEVDLATNVERPHAVCTFKERGNLSSFQWIEGPLSSSIYNNTNGRSLAHVYYSSLNSKDVMLSVGKISAMDSSSYSRLKEFYPGNEFSGKKENGERIIGITSGNGIATVVETIPHLTWRVPDSMTLEEAVSIPVIYTILINTLFFKIQLKEGDSVLIHAGSGGIGQAAINICLHFKCNIFTTVGTPEKVKFIKKTFPQIPENHIGSSRDTSFVKMIMEQTKGKGVDVVLNSIEDKFRASLRCVTEGGHFVEIGKFDKSKNNSLELGHFLTAITFYSIELDTLISKDPTEKFIKISNKLQELLDQNIIKPINRTVFQKTEVEAAIRHLASGKHTGKVVIKIRDEEPDLITKPNLLRMKVKPRIRFNENKSYVILGGMGGFGIELVDWMVIRGARNIVLSSRKGLKNGYQSYKIKLWRSYGVNVVISTVDISQESCVKEILQMATSLGPIAGIFNLTMILRDDEFSKQTEKNFRTVANPKAIATGHLDQLSRKMWNISSCFPAW